MRSQTLATASHFKLKNQNYTATSTAFLCTNPINVLLMIIRAKQPQLGQNTTINLSKTPTALNLPTIVPVSPSQP